MTTIIMTPLGCCRYLADEEAKRRGHIVLRLPPYHCQYNPIEMIWGLMKRYYDKHILEYGEFCEEKCLKIWNDAINSITPQVWQKVVGKVDHLITSDWELISRNDDCDRTDYSQFKFSVSDSDDDEFEDCYNSSSSEIDDPQPIFTTTPKAPAPIHGIDKVGMNQFF